MGKWKGKKYLRIFSQLFRKFGPPVTWSTIKSITRQGIEKVILDINGLKNKKVETIANYKQLGFAFYF